MPHNHFKDKCACVKPEVGSGQESGTFRFCATKPEAVVFHLWGEKTSVEGWGAQSATIRKAVEPGSAFQHPFVFAIFRTRDGVSRMW